MPNYPTPPTVSSIPNMRYPTDLNTNGGYYILFQVAQYSRPSLFEAPNISFNNNIALPLPLKINDQQVVTWEQSSLPQIGSSIAQALAGFSAMVLPKLTATLTGLASAAAGLYNGLGDLSGYMAGVTVNPALIMLFKTQNFKVHTFQWLFAPNSPEDSQALKQIIDNLKNSMLPTVESGGLALGYPFIVQPFLSMNEQTYDFKLCGIESIDVDWSAGANPAFFGTTGAPALISVSMTLKELELWYNGQVGTPSILGVLNNI